MKPFYVLLSASALMLPLAAADFSIDIGNPVAAQGIRKVMTKNSILAVRTQGCADSSKVHFDGVLAFLTNGSRFSVPLVFLPGSVPGTYSVGIESPLEGRSWVMVLNADCAGAKAGALIPVDGRAGYNRESAKFFGHAATNKEIDAALAEWNAPSR